MGSMPDHSDAADLTVGQAMLGKHGDSIGDPSVLRAVLGGAFYLTLIALFLLGVTTMLRRQTLALGILMPFFFLVSGILQAIPGATRATQFHRIVHRPP